MVILQGLIQWDIQVISYACDGTEVECAVQRLVVLNAPRHLTHTIKNPRHGTPDLVIKVPIIDGQAVVMIQDSKHVLKTFRNNLFSGARLLTLGNYTAIYRCIQGIVDKVGCPLYHRDVNKLDRQDDNAAARLFSADTLEFLVTHHPDYQGEIVYLFIYGELVDAYQSRHMSHAERLKSVIRAADFIDIILSFLDVAGYARSRYSLAREARDIMRILIEGFVGLILVHRDHLSEGFPLLPWLHSSETCEHVFGEARRVVKDFTMLEFIYMIPKLRVKLREAVLRSNSSDFKACAAGYTHTYYDSQGISILNLSTFPSNVDIIDIAMQAGEEAESIVALLGIIPSQLRCIGAVRPYPSIGAWYEHSESVEDYEGNDKLIPEAENDAMDLEVIMEAIEESQRVCSLREDDKLMSLSFAAIATYVDDAMQVYVLPF